VVEGPVVAAVFAEAEQAALEERAERATDYGTPEDWALAIGDHRLLLVPTTKEWLYFDTLHGTYEPTGHGAGEVWFGVANGRLGVKHRQQG
jgi:hypothetical protein